MILVISKERSEHHSGTNEVTVVKIAEGVALLNYQSQEDWFYTREEDMCVSSITCNGYLYPEDVKYEVSGKYGSTIETEPLRPLTQEEKDLLMTYQSDIEFD